MDPFKLFREWYNSVQETSPLKHRGAVCVSTVDQDGLPDGRFVDLKAFSESGFVFCTRFDSAKGLALAANPYAALTFWWDHTERQVRVVGPVQRVSDADADRYFQQRPRGAQLTTLASHQSAPLDSIAALELRVREMQVEFADAPVPRPAEWGGYCVIPMRMEFLTFKATRLHERLQFYRSGDAWSKQWLQP
jgi:pyridoxamine 5'-phosphate oxidase